MEVTLYWIILVFLVVEFALERWLEGLNRRAMSPRLPDALRGIYDEAEYARFLAYKRDGGRLDAWSSGVTFAVTLVFLAAGGFGWFDGVVGAAVTHPVWRAVVFVVALAVVSTLVELPFDYLAMFRVEERHGFNRSTRATFWADAVKGLLLTVVLGGALMAVVTWIYTLVGPSFWWMAWVVLTVFGLLMSMFYSNLIVPLFNKQRPLPEGTLRRRLEDFARGVGFRVRDIYVIDGSRRSTKANAYFTGLGPRKRVVLYDTLLDELTEDEVVAVLAHEIGHYRLHHAVKGMVVSFLHAGLMLWLFSLCVGRPELSLALGGREATFELGMMAFMLLYGPVEAVLGVAMNAWSRRHELEADAFAAARLDGEWLVSGLKKLAVKSLSNLTPHPWYEFVNYSHPSLLRRVEAIRNIKK